MGRKRKNYPEGLQPYLQKGVRVKQTGDAYYLYQGYPKKDPQTGKLRCEKNTAIGIYTEKNGFTPAGEKEQQKKDTMAAQKSLELPELPVFETELSLPTAGLELFMAEAELTENEQDDICHKSRSARRREQKEKAKLAAAAQEIERLSKELWENGLPISEKKKAVILSKILDQMKTFGKNPFPSYILYKVEAIVDEMLCDVSGRERFFSSPSDFTRNRKIYLDELVRFLMTCGAMSVDRALFRQFSMQSSLPTGSALTQQRAKLKPEGLRYLFQRIVEQISPPAVRFYAGKYRLLAIDGSDTNIAYNENSDSFVRMNTSGYNQFHVNCVYDVLNQIYCGVLVQPKGKTNETAAAVSLIRSTEFQGKVIFTADRGYGSLNLMETIKRTNNADYVIRVKESYIKEIRQLELKELDIDISFTVVTRQTNENKERIQKGECKYLSGRSKYGKNKKNVEWDYEDETVVTLRVVRFQLSSGKWETLITSLSREEFPLSELMKLYSTRYEIEYSFRYLKYSLAMSFYHSRKEDYNEQEIYANLCAYNICSVIIGYASVTGRMKKGEKFAAVETIEDVTECRWTEQKEPDQRYGYRINCTMGIYIVIDFIRNRGNVAYDVCDMIRRYRIPVRRGRNYPRKIRAQSWRALNFRSA